MSFIPNVKYTRALIKIIKIQQRTQDAFLIKIQDAAKRKSAIKWKQKESGINNRPHLHLHMHIAK